MPSPSEIALRSFSARDSFVLVVSGDLELSPNEARDVGPVEVSKSEALKNED